jgi:hypothetical protein
LLPALHGKSRVAFVHGDQLGKSSTHKRQPVLSCLMYCFN